MVAWPAGVKAIAAAARVAAIIAATLPAAQPTEAK
jgi:hypothetical protein